MKKLNLLFTALLLLCCMGTVKAEEVTIDGIRYDVLTKAKQATVIEGGNYSGEIVIPSEITHNGVTCRVTSIGMDAFYGCKGFKSIEIPNSVTSIGERAFYNCKGLESIEIPNSVTSIGEFAFSGCTGLTSVVIGNSVTSIGQRAFWYCTGLTSVEFNAENCTTMGSSLYSVFSDCTALSTITIGENVKNIPAYAFYECKGLTSIEIPNSVTSIGSSAFYYCTGLKSVIIGDGVTSIGDDAFSHCYSLKSVVIPNSVTSIGDAAFCGCAGLTSIKVESGNSFYDSRENCNALIETATNTLIQGCGSTTIPNSVTSIGSEAFEDCTALTSIVIPNSVTSIGSEAFDECKGLTSIEIPNSVTSIGNNAFYYCTGLKNVIIGDGVTSIGQRAFYGCTGLTSITIGSGVKNIYWVAFAKCENLADVYCLATTVPSTDSDAFMESYPEYMTLHVPAEAINRYKIIAPWSSFGTFVTLDGEDYIEPEPEVKVCATPVISYSNGKIEIECETEGAEFITTVTNNYAKNYYSNNFELSATYNISVYATAAGHEKSETVNATLCWIECECEGNDYTNVMNIPATAALVTSNGGVLSISCSLDGEEIAVYTTDGVLIAATTIENGTAIVATGLSKGSVAIVNIAGKSIKVAVN